MSYKFDSLMLILNKLDRNENVTVHSLMDDLEVSQRSVHRYIQTLQVAGFPIVFDKKKGTYCFYEGYSLKKPNFSIEERLAFALAKDAMKDYGIGMEDILDSLENKLSFKKPTLEGQVILKPQKSASLVKGYLGKIYEAITTFQSIEIVYKALYTSEVTTRKVDPYYTFFPEGFWILRAYCHLRGELRTFALDRMISVNILNEHFTPRNMSPEEELSTSFGVWLDGEIVDVVLRFDKECKSHIQRKVWHQSQKEKNLKDGRIELSFKVKGLEDIKHWIYGWIPHVEVVAPKELKNTIKKDLQKAIKKFK